MDEVRLRPERTTLAAVLVLMLGALPLGLSSPYLVVVLLVPVAALVWVLRARVVADATSLEICNGLGVQRIAWDDVAGFTVPKRGPVKLLRHGNGSLLLTAVNRHELPKLLAVSEPAT
ncbi:MAG: PH domain-containing protein [Actinomycetota bacterium]|nr:PH domain-containing protein [Actinomycetota bacterium]